MKRVLAYMPLPLDGKCEYCGRHRSHGKHNKCSVQRKRDNDSRRAQEAAHA